MRHLPKGAGRVRCTACGATAAADGNGSPIIVRCAPGCSESAGGATASATPTEVPADPGSAGSGEYVGPAVTYDGTAWLLSL